MNLCHMWVYETACAMDETRVVHLETKFPKCVSKLQFI